MKQRDIYRYQTPIGHISLMCLTTEAAARAAGEYLECRGQAFSSGAYPELYFFFQERYPDWNGCLPRAEDLGEPGKYGRWLIKAKLQTRL